MVVRGYEGLDAVGRRTTAVRAATPRGVVMALGPLDARDAARTTATELVVPAAAQAASGATKRVFGDINNILFPALDQAWAGKKTVDEVWRKSCRNSNRCLRESSNSLHRSA